MKEQILAHLRKDKIKLWLEPYCDANGSSVHGEIQALSESLVAKLTLTDDDTSGNREQITTHLVELQSHALQRLWEKNAVVIKLIHHHKDSVPPNGVAPALSSWGQTITEESKGNNSSLHLKIRGMDAKLTPNKVMDGICRVLDAKSVRLIWKGKTIACDATPIIELISGKQKKGSKTKTAELLCIVSGRGYSPPSPQSVAVAPDQLSSTPIDTATAPRTDRSIIQSIKSAATKLQFSSSGFEITDQRGQLVSMSRADSVSFLVALGMHRLARSRIHESQELNDESQKREHIASALVFLLEADQEWENSSVLQNWKSVVDNYGLLQLDIAWCYLLLESLDDLNDALRRLDAAEGCLKKQVHSNFVTLAVVQAEMGNPIPPLCAVFVRLFLLQGVASRLQGRNDTAREKMEMSRLLCGRLRESSPSESVEALAGACWVDPATAISALRRGNGELDQAANIIAADNKEEREATLKRRRQHRVGKCANGDYCNIDLASSLASLIGFDDVNLEGLLDDENEDEPSTSVQLVIGLLRLSNNDVNAALELFNNTGAEEVIMRVNRLDGGRAKAKKPRVDKKKNHEVRDMDLVSLVSMGVDSAQARRALEATGNVDAAILWISADDGKPDDDSCSSTEQQPPREMSLFERSGYWRESRDAQRLLEAELGDALGSDSKQQLEKEWLGLSLDEEWDLIQRYTA